MQFLYDCNYSEFNSYSYVNELYTKKRRFKIKYYPSPKNFTQACLWRLWQNQGLPLTLGEIILRELINYDGVCKAVLGFAQVW